MKSLDQIREEIEKIKEDIHDNLAARELDTPTEFRKHFVCQILDLYEELAVQNRSNACLMILENVSSKSRKHFANATIRSRNLHLFEEICGDTPPEKKHLQIAVLCFADEIFDYILQSNSWWDTGCCYFQNSVCVALENNNTYALRRLRHIDSSNFHTLRTTMLKCCNYEQFPLHSVQFLVQEGFDLFSLVHVKNLNKQKFFRGIGKFKYNGYKLFVEFGDDELNVECKPAMQEKDQRQIMEVISDLNSLYNLKKTYPKLF